MKIHWPRRLGFWLAAGLLSILLLGLLTQAGPLLTTNRLLIQAQEKARAGDRLAAEADYRRALRELPNDPYPALHLADLYQEWNRPADALNALNEALRRGAAPSELESQRLTLLGATDQWTTLKEAARTRLQSHPTETPTLQLLTRAHLRHGECAEAAQTADRWQTADPQNPQALLTWSMLQPALNVDPARLTLCRITPELCTILYTCTSSGDCDVSAGRNLLARQQPDLAVCVLQRAVAALPQSATAHTWLGAALEQSRRGAPLDHFQRATDLAPNDPAAWLLLGMYQLRQGQLSAAQSALEKAHQLDTKNPAPCLGLIGLAVLKSDYPATERWTTQAILLAQDDPEILKSIARFYLERNLQLQKWPLEVAQQAVLQAPDDAEAQMLLGWSQFKEGDLSSALLALDEALTLDPTLAYAHLLRGYVLEQLGRSADAEAEFTRALNLNYTQ